MSTGESDNNDLQLQNIDFLSKHMHFGPEGGVINFEFFKINTCLSL